MKKINLEKGQMLLIVILVMVVALTIGLSVVTRTITNVRTSSEEESSQRAFSAAEAGVEQSLITKNNYTNVSLGNNASYSTKVDTVQGTQFLLNNGSPILKDDSGDIWLSSYPDYAPSSQWSGQLTIYWGTPGDTCATTEPPAGTNTMAAIEVVVISGAITAPQIAHLTYDPCPAAVGRQLVNNFTSVSPLSGTVNGKTFAFQQTIPIASGLIAKVIPVYAQTPVGVKGDNLLPAQGTVITSIGTSDTSQRKIVTFRSYPKLPIELFPFVIFSPK